MKKIYYTFLLLLVPTGIFAQEVDMVLIEGGTFTMGSPGGIGGEAGRDSYEREHQVTVSSFYMSRYEVTQAQYRAVMNANPSHFRGDSLPVERVVWLDAVKFCNGLSEKEGLTPVYTINGLSITADWSANGYRLPTEAEWEYACRAGTTTPYHYGRRVDNSMANFANPVFGGSKTVDVGSFEPNAFGLYDMHGNVSEWCWDFFGQYPSTPQTDPRGHDAGLHRIIRGGSWDNPAPLLRSAKRIGHSGFVNKKSILGVSVPELVNTIGIRLVRNAG